MISSVKEEEAVPYEHVEQNVGDKPEPVIVSNVDWVGASVPMKRCAVLYNIVFPCDWEAVIEFTGAARIDRHQRGGKHDRGICYEGSSGEEDCDKKQQSRVGQRTCPLLGNR